MKFFSVFFLLISITNLSIAQQDSVLKNHDRHLSRYSDFHIHTSFKEYYRRIDHPDVILKYSSYPDSIKLKFGDINWDGTIYKPSDRLKGKVSNLRNYDQADFSEIKNLNGSILCSKLYPFEEVFTRNALKRLLNSTAVTGITLKRLKTISKDDVYPFKELISEYHFITNQNHLKNGSKLQIVKGAAELRESIGKNNVSIILAIEGGHAFLDSIHYSKSNVNSWEPCIGDCFKSILVNVDSVRRFPYKIHFITLSHFTWNRISGYAKSLENKRTNKYLRIISSNPKFHKALFNKPGEGIHGEIDRGEFIDTIYKNYKFILPHTTDRYVSQIGKEVVARLLVKDSHNPIWIDVRHMDIKAREDYYKMRDSLQELYGYKIPIIASHFGVSGENLELARATGSFPLFDLYPEVRDPEKFYKKQAKADQWWKYYYELEGLPSINPFANYDKETVGSFYPWSINLYNEEIKVIYDSDGIIGLNFDERILGGYMKKYKKGSKYYKQTKADLKAQYSNLDFNYSYKNFNEFLKAYYESEPLIRNLIYVVEESERKDSTAWKHVAIGADFDGLIDPIDTCPTAAFIPTFHNQMVDFLKVYLLLRNKQDLLYGLSCEDAINKFFYENGKEFNLKYFDRTISIRPTSN